MSANPPDEKAIFEAACGIESAAARNDYLKQACAGNQALYDRLATLLRMREEEPDFLEAPAPGLAGIIDVPPITEKPGTLLGPYKLIEPIGEGGMGLVFMARQQERVKRNVALKIIKPGMDTRQVIARFEAERQALALMEHANIARVLDAGSTDSGRPYFVMDLVKGIPITEYCDQERLSMQERLELFVPICQAIQHAHQKGIIHRDIKPTNVLITLHDGTPVPKVIDFGVAKATNRELTQESLVTGFAQVLGTPLYMSPEQAALSGLDIDTRSDVYSLGVLLYELLIGTTPFDQERLSNVSYDEMCRVVREEEPPKPSARISTLGESLATIAGNRHTDGRMLAQQVRGELDWVVMKALEKDRRRRYETADALARDVRRYLSHEPVEACPPSATYRLRKFIRRNNRLAMAVAVAVMGLVIGTGVATWQAVRATEAEGIARQQEQLATSQKEAAEAAAARERALRTEAERQRARAEANLRLALDALEEVFLRVTPRKGPEGPESKGRKEALLRSTLKFYERFAATNRTAPETWPLVRELYGKVLTIQQELAEQSPHVVGYRYALARAMAGLASLLENSGRTGEARELHERAMRVQEQLVEDFPTVAEYRDGLAASHENLTNLLLAAGQNQRAEKHRAAAEEVRAAPLSAAQSKPIAPIRFDRFRRAAEGSRSRETSGDSSEVRILTNSATDESEVADSADLHLVGDAALVEDRLRLTPLDSNRHGAAWNAEKQLVALGFETVFTFRMTGVPDGADGFAFVVQNHRPSSLGPYGSALGYGDSYDDIGGIPNSLAIEFDTFSNHQVYDLPWNHISVQTNGTSANSVNHAFSLAGVVAPIDLNDGNEHRVRIRYLPGTLTIFVDGSQEPALTVPIELSTLLDLDRGQAWVGFTASTGAEFQTHDILSWEFVPLVDESEADAFFRSHPSFNGKPKAPEERESKRLRLDVKREAPPAGVPPSDSGPSAEDFPFLADGYEMREFERAIQYRHAATRLDPSVAWFHDYLAWALAVCPDPQFRDPQRAVRSARLAVKLDPEHPGRRNTLGVALYRIGQWQAAIDSLHKSDSLEEYRGSAYNGFFFGDGLLADRRARRGTDVVRQIGQVDGRKHARRRSA